jgi:hypothetical protein
MDEEGHQADNLNFKGSKYSLYFIHILVSFMLKGFKDFVELDLLDLWQLDLLEKNYLELVCL